jgi:hypothetical protein
MYRTMNLAKIYEQMGEPNASPDRVKEMIIKLSPQSIKDLGQAISSKGIFEIPVFEIKMKSGPITQGGAAFFAIKPAGGHHSPENIEKLSKLINVPGNYAFDTQDKEISSIFELSFSGDRVSIPLKISNQEKPITIHFVREDNVENLKTDQTEPVSTPSENQNEPSMQVAEPIGSALTTGVIDTTSENRSLNSFDSFISKKFK